MVERHVPPAVVFFGLRENLEEKPCWLSSTAVAAVMTVQVMSAKAGLLF